MSVLYDTVSFIKRLHLLVGAAESKFKKIIDQKACWKLVVDLDSFPNSQWRHGRVACSIAYLMEDVFYVFPRKQHVQQYPELMLHKMRLLENVSENMTIRLYGHKHTM